MIIPLKEFKKALSDIAPAISTSPVVPILENILLEVKDYEVKVTGSSLQNTIIRTFQTGMKNEEVKICLPFQLINQFLGKMNAVEVEIKITDPSRYIVEVKSGKAKAKISGESATDYPKTELDSAAVKLEVQYDLLYDIIRKCAPLTSNDELRPQMTGVNLEVSEDLIISRSTDGHRGVIFQAEIAGGQPVKLTVSRHISMLQKLFKSGESLNMAIADNKVEITSENTTFRTWVIDEKFPDLDHVFPNLKDGRKMIIDRHSLIKELETTELFADKTTSGIKLTFNTDKLKLEAKDMDFGNDFDSELPCDYSGGDFEIGINKQLKDTLKTFDADEIEIYHFNDQRRPLAIIDGDHRAIVMPVMLTEFVPKAK